MANSNTDQIVAQHFDSMAEIYADNYTNGSFFSYFFNQRLKVIFSFLENWSHATVLDIGCGPGMMAEYCIERGFEFFGIDISEKMIDECINKFGHSSSTHFSVGKLQYLDFPDSSFDIVLCMGALEYVDNNEIENALLEMVRVLKPEGQIVLSLMNENSFFSWHRRVKNSIKSFLGMEDRTKSYDALSKPFCENSFRALLSSKQLNNIETVRFGLNIYPYFLEWRIPDRLKIKLSNALDSIIKGRFKWPYMAFIVSAKKT